MSETTPYTPTHAATEPSFFQKAKKAFSAALTGGIVAAAPLVVASASEGFTTEEILACVAVGVGAAVAAFFATYLPKNAE